MKWLTGAGLSEQGRAEGGGALKWGVGWRKDRLQLSMRAGSRVVRQNTPQKVKPWKEWMMMACEFVNPTLWPWAGALKLWDASMRWEGQTQAVSEKQRKVSYCTLAAASLTHSSWKQWRYFKSLTFIRISLCQMSLSTNQTYIHLNFFLNIEVIRWQLSVKPSVQCKQGLLVANSA